MKRRLSWWQRVVRAFQSPTVQAYYDARFETESMKLARAQLEQDRDDMDDAVNHEAHGMIKDSAWSRPGDGSGGM